MGVSRRALIASMAGLFALGFLAFAVSASGHGSDGRNGGGTIFRFTLTPSLHTDPAIHGVAPGGLDWALAEGLARLGRQGAQVEEDEGDGDHGDQGHEHRGGRQGERGERHESLRLQLSPLMLRLRVEQLVLRGTSSPGPVTTIKASIFCGSDTAPAFLSPSAPLSAHGNASLKVPVSLSKCLAPVVLVHPNGDTTHYIAVSGFGN